MAGPYLQLREELPLPSYDPAEGSILDFFEPKSGWAETAHFQPLTPRG